MKNNFLITILLILTPVVTFGTPAGEEIKEFFGVQKNVGWFGLRTAIEKKIPEHISRENLLKELLNLSEMREQLIHLEQTENYLVQYFFETHETDGTKTKYDCRVVYEFTKDGNLEKVGLLYDSLVGENIEPVAGGDATR